MPMTYSDAIVSIEQNNWFRSRVREATSIYSNYLLNAATDDPEYASKISAGTRIASSADMVISTLMFTLSGDAEVLAAGPAIADAQLQMIVEKTIVKFYPVQPVTPAALGYYPPPPLPMRPPQ